MYDRTCVIHGTKIERKIVRTNELKLNLSSHRHLFGKVAQRVVVLAVVVVVACHGGPVLVLVLAGEVTAARHFFNIKFISIYQLCELLIIN